MTYNQILDRLRKITPEEYSYEAKILVESFTDYKSSYLILNADEDFDSNELEEALQKREDRIPLQYIIGKWDFYRQTYVVNENCLIPRSDTEILVEKAIELLPPNAHFFDFCTGSGCIGISVLCERQDTIAHLFDNSSKALMVARENISLNGVKDRANLVLLNLITYSSAIGEWRADAILCNPPYIRPEVIETLSPEVKKEPYEALYGGEDGLLFYRNIIRDYSKCLKKDGFFLFEIGYDQADDICKISKENGFECRIFKDYGANDRVAYVYKNE